MILYAAGCLVALCLYEALYRITASRRTYSNVHSTEFERLL
jgi:hypothetical protein